MAEVSRTRKEKKAGVRVFFGFTTEARSTQSGPFDFAQGRLCARNWKICVNRRNLRIEVVNAHTHSLLPTVLLYEWRLSPGECGWKF